MKQYNTEQATHHDHGTFKKSSYSGSGGCVEVAIGGNNVIQVRDSKQRTEEVLSFTALEWEAFVRGVKDGEFDINTTTGDA